MTSIVDIDPETNIPIVDPEKDYFSELVGEGKIYKTEKDLARAVAEKEAMILRLKQEKTEVLEDLKASQATKSLEELIDQLRPLRQEPQSPSNLGNQTHEPDTAKGLSISDVERLLQERELNQRRLNNKNEVINKLRESFGAHYVQKVQDTAKTLGVDVKYLDFVAESTPSIFYRLMGMENVITNTATPPHTRVNSDVIAPTSTNKRDRLFYDNLRKTDPVKYNSKEIQNQKYQDMLDAFRRGDNW